MSAVNEVVNRLVTLATTALPTWQVIDGWNRADELAILVMSIAQPTGPGVPAVTSEVAEDEGGLCATVETITVSCVAASWDGEVTFTGKRQQVADALDTLDTAVKADRKLGGIAYDSWVGVPGAQWYQEVDERGATVQCDFAITVEVHAE
jgi:hypothetical protein